MRQFSSLALLARIDYLDVGVLPAVCEAFIVPTAMSLALVVKLHIIYVTYIM